MKKISLLILTLLFSNSVLAQSKDVLAPEGTLILTMARCISVKYGTVWASFGRQTTSESVRYFPTEIAHFATKTSPSTRKVFDNIDDALKLPVRYGTGRFMMMFATNDPNVGIRIHHISVKQQDYPNEFLGTWTVRQDGKPDLEDQVGCNIF